jgi:hypothetical protein
MKRALLAVFTVLTIAMPAFSQVVITKQDYDIYKNKKVTSSTYSSISMDGIQAVADRSGSNEFFDFSTIEFSQEPDFVDVDEYIVPTNGHAFWHVEAFRSANMVIRQKSDDDMIMGYEFVEIKDDGVYMLGYGEYDLQIGLAGEHVVFETPVLVERVPRHIGMGWLTELPFEFDFEAEEIRKIQEEGEPTPTIRLSNFVDGWGKIKFPNGQTYDALRIHVTSTFTFMGMTIRREYIRYETKAGHSAEIDLDQEGNAEAATYTMSTMDVITSDPGDRSDLPDGFALEQNYPNPFNPSTTIGYSIPFSADVTLSVIDLTGRVVARMDMPRQSAGTHKVQLDAAQLSSGVYLYQIQAGGYSASRKFTLVK